MLAVCIELRSLMIIVFKAEDVLAKMRLCNFSIDHKQVEHG